MYPNPASANLSIEGELGQVLICDALGRELANYKKNQYVYSIDTQQLTNGVYLLKLISETGEINTKRIIINR